MANSPAIQFGLDNIGLVGVNGPTTVAMAALNTGWCARFIAPDTRDIASVYVNWGTVTAAGQVTVRIETIDAATGKPSGSLYDAAATLAFTPVSGWQILTFASLPTAGLVAGDAYGIVLLTTTGGTTHGLSSSTVYGSYPTIVLTAADGTTRSNFAEVTSTVPICTLVMEDAAEEVLQFCPYAGGGTATAIFGTVAAGAKFIVPTGQTWTIQSVQVNTTTRTGTPAGDLRVRILDSSDAAVANSTVTTDKDYLLNVSARQMRILFPTPPVLTAGTYRAIFDSASSANSSNCWTIRPAAARAAGNVPSDWIATTTTDVTAGPPITWVDVATSSPNFFLNVASIAAAGGGGAARLIGGGLISA